MDNTSLAYKEGKYADIFDAARSNRVRKEDVVYYSQSLEKLREYKDGMKRTAEDSWAKGLAEGRAEGRAEGEELERRKGIRMMLARSILRGGSVSLEAGDAGHAGRVSKTLTGCRPSSP